MSCHQSDVASSAPGCSEQLWINWIRSCKQPKIDGPPSPWNCTGCYKISVYDMTNVMKHVVQILRADSLCNAGNTWKMHKKCWSDKKKPLRRCRLGTHLRVLKKKNEQCVYILIIINRYKPAWLDGKYDGMLWRTDRKQIPFKRVEMTGFNPDMKLGSERTEMHTRQHFHQVKWSSKLECLAVYSATHKVVRANPGLMRCSSHWWPEGAAILFPIARMQHKASYYIFYGTTPSKSLEH